LHILLTALFSLTQVLSYPFPAAVTAGPDGKNLAYVLNERGVRSVWFADGDTHAPHMIWSSKKDDGQEITSLEIAKNAKYVLFVRGGAHDSNWVEHPWPNPDNSPIEPQLQLISVPSAGGEPKVLGTGDYPAIDPDSATVAFLRDPDGAVMSAPLDGSKPAKQLFFDRGHAAELTWSPDGKALAFTSDRGDHSFIALFRNSDEPIEYIAPSTNRDSSPQWSPDGTHIAYVRLHGSGGPPHDPLARRNEPWAIWVADAANGHAHEAWHSGTTLRDSVPGIKGPQLSWLTGNRLLFVSEHTNWPNLYTVSASGGAARDITPGAFMVEDVSVTPDFSTVYYTANTGRTPGDQDRRHIFRVTANGGVHEVTSGTSSEWWPAALTDGVAYVQAGSRAPTVVALNGRVLDADQVPADFPTSQLVVPKYVSFRSADGTLVHGQIFETSRGGAHKPGIIYVHGGPPRQMMTNWHYFDYYSYDYAENQYLASRGFVVLSVNYRLGIGYGHDFQNPAHAGPAGASEYQDVVAGAKYLMSRPNVDAKRIGMYGGSYGGFLTAMALAKNSNIFKAGVDRHGVHDWSEFPEWYGTGAQTRYQDFDRKKFLRTAWLSSPDAYISTWRSPVLLIQGDDDRNVRFHQTVDLAERLRDAHVPYQEYVIPNEIHGFLRWHSWYESGDQTAQFLIDHLHP
jgi:dipeptidyl aminopeptidase/acylaminoacyl peptidase